MFSYDRLARGSRSLSGTWKSGLMALKGFTTFLIPDEGRYEVAVPRFPGCTTWGETLEEAFAHAREAMELIGESPSEIDLDTQDLPTEFHVIVGGWTSRSRTVPSRLLRRRRLASDASTSFRPQGAWDSRGGIQAFIRPISVCSSTSSVDCNQYASRAVDAPQLFPDQSPFPRQTRSP